MVNGMMGLSPTSENPNFEGYPNILDEIYKDESLNG